MLVGILFIIGTVSGSIAAALMNPLLDAPDYLTALSANEGKVTLSAFLIFVMGMACAGIGLALYPILKKYSEGRAIGAAGFRVIEGVLDVMGGLGMIGLLALSGEYVQAGASAAGNFQSIGAVITAANAWLNNGAVLISWCIGAFLYYSVFYQFRLVPRWLSVWGLVGISLTIVTSSLQILNVIPAFGLIQTIANLPIALQEMVFALWLIIKGINDSLPAAQPI
jgi:hypothetical protein